MDANQLMKLGVGRVLIFNEFSFIAIRWVRKWLHSKDYKRCQRGVQHTAHAIVVDDEEDIRELVRYNLTKGGFNVVTAASGEEGLSIAEEIKPSLIVLDIMLPGIDGLEVCRRLKSNPALKKIPIVMISALGDEKDVVAGLELGADDYVSKPFSPGVLLARVKTVIRRTGAAPVDIQASLY